MHGNRVKLRHWELRDAPFVFDLYSRWDVQRFLGQSPAVMEHPAQADALLARLCAVDDSILGYWAVQTVSSEKLVGTVMLQNIRLSGTHEPSDEVEVGWHFHPDAWGRGYATEAAEIVLKHGFDSGLDRVIAVAHSENGASLRVCQRLGMQSEGTTNRYYDAEYEVFAAHALNAAGPTIR